MTLTNLYNIAECDDIGVYSYDLDGEKSLSLMDEDRYFIAIDPFEIESENDEKVKLAHELGHCINGAFYNMYSPLDIRSKHEYTANKWAIKKLIPEDELKEACKFCRNRWELSEYFDVPEDFMQKALDYYSEQAVQ